MPLPTVNDVGAVDPVLTNMLIGYQQNDMRFVAGRVFPNVSVVNDSGTYYIFTKKYFFFDDLEERAAGAEFGQLGFGVSTGTYTTLQYAGALPIADEVVANNQAPMSLERAALIRLAQASLIKKEVKFAADFMTTSVWATDDNNSATDWDDFQSGDPVTNILTAARTISNNTGQRANTMVLGGIVYDALVNHPDVIDRLKYTRAAGIGAVDAALAEVFNMQNFLVSWATYSNTNENASFSATAIIDDDCLVCYVDPGADMFAATAGKTFVWPGGGGAGQVRTYYSDEHNATMIQHKEQWDQVVTATDLGYFFADIV